jgi:hypothetical protein
MKFLQRLLPERWRTKLVPTSEARAKMLATVADNDPGFAACQDIQQETLEREFYAAIDFNRTDGERLRACEGMRVAFYTMHRLEGERAAARSQK